MSQVKPLKSNIVKIAEAARILKVHKDTLRRWEKAGKIKVTRDETGNRLYDISHLAEIAPSTTSTSVPQQILDTKQTLTTEELLKGTLINTSAPKRHTQELANQNMPEYPGSSKSWKLTAGLLTIAIALLLGSLLYVRAAIFHAPTNSLNQASLALSDVLGENTAQTTLRINANEKITGSLSVDGSINGLALEATPSASTITFISGSTSLTVTNSAVLDQDVSTTSTPTFAGLNLSGAQNILEFQSGSSTGTLSWAPTGDRVITLPDATTTLVGLDTTQTLTNKSLSGSSNTFTNIPNSALTNSKVTVTAGTNLTGGGDISLGSSITISLKDSPSVTTLTASGIVSLASGTAAAPALTFTDDLNTGLYRIGTDKIGLITGGIATSGITIDASGNLGVGTISPGSTLAVSGNGSIGASYASLAPPGNGLIIQGNVGIGTSAPGSFALNVNGDANISGNLITGGSISFSSLSNGSVVFAGSEGSLSQNNPNFYWDNTNQRLGIGTSAPSQIFQVNPNGSSAFVVTSSGNIGIGITSPAYKLDVSGTIRATNRLLTENICDEKGSNCKDIRATRWSRLSGDGNVSSSVKIASDTNGGPTLADSDRFGRATASIGDLNNDGVEDLAVGTYYDDTGGSGRGAVYVLFMNSNGTVSSSVKIASDTNGGPTLTDSDSFGGSVASTGDLNGDGVEDLAVGAPGDDTGGSGRGAVYVLFMNSNGTVSSSVKIASGTNGGPTLVDGDNIGTSVTSTGDLNGDGIGDLAAGAYTDDTGGTNRGAVHILFMNTDGTVASSAKIASDTNGGPTLTDTDVFGTSVANTGDLNGDGINDLAVGAYLENTGGTDRGAVFILFMNANGTAASSVKIASGTNGGPTLADSNYFGVSVANTGDLNGDGINDLAVGAIDDTVGADRGAVYILFMNIAGTVSSSIKISSDANGGPTLADSAWFGMSIASIGDLNGDGIGDLAVGAHRDSTGGTERGAIHILFMAKNNINFAGQNVGIGVTTPGSMLSIAGNGVFGFGGATSIAGPSNGLGISGNLGIGTTSPNNKLQVIGAGVFGADYGQYSAPANGVLIQGNIGIGSTGSVNYGLDVWGTGRITSDLTIGGNIGVGGTASFSSSIYSQGSFYGINGSATAPAYSFTNLTNAGLWTNGDGLLLTTGGSNTSGITVTGAGNVGIGTTSTSQLFQINSNTSNPVVITSGGNIGIGTTSPQDAVHVSGTGITQIRISSTNSSGVSSRFVLYNDINALGQVSLVGSTASGSNLALLPSSLNLATTGSGGLALITTSANAPMIFATGGSGLSNERMRINSSGNVGIGTSAPAQLFQVSTGLAFDSSNIRLGIGTTSPNNKLQVIGAGVFGADYGQYSAPLNGVLVQGNVGIGSTGSVNYGLDVWGTGRITGALTTGGTITPGGQFLALDGTVGAPSYSFASDTDTGIYRPSANAMSLSTNGANVMTLTQAGNVGIGTTSPESLLHISADTNANWISSAASGSNNIFLRRSDGTHGSKAVPAATSRLGGLLTQVWDSAAYRSVTDIASYVENSATSDDAAGYLSFFTRPTGAAASLTERVRITSAGNVGIGTTTPNSLLSIAGNAHIGSIRQGISAPTDGLFVDGNVGIGATTSSNKLDVWGNARIAGTLAIDSTSTFGGNLTLTGNLLPSIDDTFDLGSDSARWANVYVGPATLHIGTSTSDEYTLTYDTTNNRLGFNANGSGPAEIVFDSNGNIGIGTTSPIQRFQINNSTSNPFVITSGGNVGIGTTSPNAQLNILATSDQTLLNLQAVAGQSSKIMRWLDSSGAELGSIDNSGNIVVATANSSSVNINQQIGSLDYQVFNVTNTGTVSITQRDSTLGTGADGACTVSSTVTLDAASSNTCAGRATADAVNFRVTANTAAGATTVTTSTTPTGLAVGDEILIINLRGTSSDYSNVGQYETHYITAINSSTLTLDSALTNGYDGTTQDILVQRIPQYTNITIASGGTLTTTAYSTSTHKGGVLFFRATGTVTVRSGGTITVAGKGFAGGATAGTPYGGVTYNGTGGTAGSANPPSGNGGSGQGGGGAAGGFGTGGAGTIGGAGGGGSQYRGAGGGGGYGTVGSGGGGDYGSGQDGQNGSGTTGGNGGDAPTSDGSGGGGGGTYGSADLSTLYLGSGGGGGRDGNGANGGGILFIGSSSVIVVGTISANGDNSSNVSYGSGGGGAGGSLWIKAANLTLGSSIVTASGGSAGTHSEGGSTGGAGGSGRIKLDYTTTSGTTSPAAGSTSTWPDSTSPSLLVNKLAPFDKILELQVGGSDKFYVNADGSLYAIADKTSGNTFDFIDTQNTTGNALGIGSSAMTTGNIINITESGSQTFSGNMLYGNIGMGGTFTGNFLKLENNGDTKLQVNFAGGVGIGGTAYVTNLISTPGYSLSNYGAISQTDTSEIDGTGADGACSVTDGTITLDAGSSNSCAGRGTADAINYNIATSILANATTINIGTTPTGIAAGDEILIINLRGTSSDYSNVGKYETHYVKSVSGDALTLDTPLVNSYDGTTQKIMIQRVPQYTTVTIGDSTGAVGSAVLTVGAYNNTNGKGGVIFFRATGAVTVSTDGTITTAGKGYAKGTGGSAGAGGTGGASYNGTGGNGGSNGGSGSSGQGGGGGDGGGGSVGTGTTGGAGGGGGYIAGGGGGGGYGTVGTGANNGSGTTGGDGGTGSSGEGGGGGSYGSANLSTIYFGSGGAGGGGTNGAGSGDGGNGGGILFISTPSITVNGTVSANGDAGMTGSGGRGSGGGGAGGSLWIKAATANLGSSIVTAAGGAGGSYESSTGGTGGTGRIRLDYTTASGVTSPTAGSINNFSAPSLYINRNSSIGDILGLQYAGTDKFRIDSSGNILSAVNSIWQPLVDSTHSLGIGNSASNVFVSFDTQNQRVGIGTTGPGAMLSVSGNGVFGFGGATSIAGPANGLAISGNVGIGTTSPRMPLEIWGSNGYAATFLNGNVGIGTTSPTALLQIQGDGSASKGLIINNNTTSNGLTSYMSLQTSGDTTNWSLYKWGGNTGRGGSLWFSNDGGSTGQLVLTGGGNLGIGFTSPADMLHVSKNSSVGIRIHDTRGEPWRFISGSQNAGDLAIANGSNVRMLVDTSGNFGIGTVSPVGKLHLLGSGTSTAPTFLTQNSAKTNFGLAVLDNGNVGIGTTSPSAAYFGTGPYLHLQSGTNTALVLEKTGDSARKWEIGVNTQGKLMIADGSTAADVALQIDTNGNLGIGATTSSNKLDVWGNSRISGTLTVDSTTLLANNFVVTPTGLVGVGITNPQTNFQIGSVPNPALYTSLGNVGIGTTGLSSRLSIEGNVSITDTSDTDGTGADGACSVTDGTITLDAGSSNTCAGRATADAVNYNIATSLSSGSTTINVGATPTGIASGDEILVINLRGTSTDYANVGKYETHYVTSVSGNSLTLDSPLVNTYDGTTQKIMVQRVPQYTTVTIGDSSGGAGSAVLTTSAYNNTNGEGGVIFFRATGAVTINTDGKVDAAGKGYTGGTSNAPSGGNGGTTYNGTGGAGGVSSGTDGTSGQGGGGGSWNANVGGAGTIGGAGGGGANWGGAGGGGGYGTVGNGGTGAENGSSTTGGDGGCSNGCTGGETGGGGGGGGGSYGSINLSQLYLGSGGGASRNRAGGAGGGIIFFAANAITMTGTISANGATGTAGTNTADDRDGGSGAGGSVHLKAATLTLGSSLVTSSGGATGPYGGGAGGVGRVRLDYTSSSGVTSPGAGYTGSISPSLYINRSNSIGDILGLQYAGTDKFRIDSSGNILSAVGAIWQPLVDSTHSLGIGNSASNVFVSFDTQNQRVGIGTTGPGAMLSVSGNGVFGFGGATSIAGPSNGLGISGNLGIGTTTPNNKLQVIGGGVFGNDYAQYSAPSNGLLVQGNVGIGSTTSSNKLDVWGNARLTGTLTVDSTSILNGNVGIGTNDTGSYRLTVSGAMYASGNVEGQALQIYNTGANNYIGGNLGINISSPIARLNVAGTATSTGLAFLTQGTGATAAFGLAALDNGNVGIGSTNPVQRFQINGSTSNPLVFTSGGNLGIGTTSPNAQLNILATSDQTLLNLRAYAGQTNKLMRWFDAAGTELGSIDNSGNIVLVDAEANTINVNQQIGSLDYNVFEVANTGTVTITHRDTALGTGADGACTVSSTVTLDAASSNTCVGRENADAVNFRITADTAAAATTVTVSTTPTGLAVGDEVLIINLRGTSGDYDNVGKYETHYITAINSSTLTLDSALTNGYDGTTQDILVQRIPQYTNVTVQGGGTITTSAYSTSTHKGGVLFFRATGLVDVQIGGTISASGKGYPGGATGTGNGNNGKGGTTYNGIGGQGGATGAGGASGQGGGGGGGQGTQTGGAGTTGGAGGGGGNDSSGGGGGGGYGDVGSGGTYRASNGSGTAGGDGGNSISGGGNGGGGGGGTYGSADLSQIYFGSGAGASGRTGVGAGGAGGGIVFIATTTLTVNGSISSNGGTGAADSYAGAGGGAGGSIYIKSITQTLGSSLVTASGGSAGGGSTPGGTGGVGRIRLDYTNSSGITSPSAGSTNTWPTNTAAAMLIKNASGNILQLQDVFGADKFYVAADGSVYSTSSRATGYAYDLNATHNTTGTALNLTALGTTTGNALGIGTSAMTTGNIINITERGAQNFSGNMLYGNMGIGGTFSGNFITLDNNGVTRLQVDNAGRIGIGGTAYSPNQITASGFSLSNYGAISQTDTTEVDGTGADGACSITDGTVTLDADSSNTCAGRGTADAVNYNISTLLFAGLTTINAGSTPTGIAAGDEILIINLRGTSTDYSSVGKYETRYVTAVSGTYLTLDKPLQNTYDGTTQKVMIQRIPQYTTVDIGDNTGAAGSAILTVGAYNNTNGKGGVIFFRATGAVTVKADGKIDGAEKGYAGGASPGGFRVGGNGGMTYNGTGGTGTSNTPTPGQGGGAAGSGGSNAGTIGGAGGGGSTGGNAGGGGGAGYGTVGSGGSDSGQSGSGETGGNGAGGTFGGGGGGGTYGTTNLAQIYFGSGAGSGGRDGSTGGAGGNGGGIVFIGAPSITVVGSISANGGNGGNSSAGDAGDGGGGAGGSVYLKAATLNTGSSLVTASGGSSGSGTGRNGGAGGTGRIRLDYTNASGTVSPTAGYTDNFSTPSILVNRSSSVGDILGLQYGGTDKFRIDSSGNILSATGAIWQPLVDSTRALGIGNSASNVFVSFDTQNQRVGIGTTNPVQKFQVGSGTKVLAFDVTNGRLGIGHTSPSAFLDIRDPDSNAGLGVWNNSNNQLILGTTTNTNLIFSTNRTNVWTDANGDKAMILTTAGNVGIGTTTANYKLDVYGTGRFTSLSGEGNRAVYSTADGQLTNSASDVRLKTNIQTLSDRIDVLGALDQLRGVYFSWNQDIPEGKIYGVEEEVGMIAQEVEAVLPGLVGINANGYKSLNYAQMSGFLIEVGKAQQKEIVSQGQTLDKLNTLLEGLTLDQDGNLVIPAIKTGTLVLDPSIINTSSIIPAEAPLSQASKHSWGAGIQLSDKLASLESRIAALEEQLATSGNVGIGTTESTTSSTQQFNNITIQQSATDSAVLSETTSSATSSAVLTDVQTPGLPLQITTDSASIATDSAQVSTPSASLSEATSSATEASSSSSLNTAYDILNTDPDLTPPDILYATGSAQLANLTVHSEATVSGQLTAYDLDVQNGLKALGKTTLSDTTIAGTLNIDGTLSIENGSEINVMGTLYLQRSAFSEGIDMFDGKVTIDAQGNITTQGKISASQVVTNKLTISNNPIATSSGVLGATIGSDIIPAGQTEIPVFTSVVNNSSKVFLTATSSTGGQALVVSDIIDNAGFVVSLDHAYAQDIKFNWWIIDTN